MVIAEYDMGTTSKDLMKVNEGRKHNIAPFLLRLYEILSNERDDIVGWNEDGTAFEIRNKELMVELILPNYFNNKNFASFQRQLNYFGFRKWSKFRSSVCTYSREYFVRGQFNDLHLVKRQSKTAKSSRIREQNESSTPSSPRSPETTHMDRFEPCSPDHGDKSMMGIRSSYDLAQVLQQLATSVKDDSKRIVNDSNIESPTCGSELEEIYSKQVPHPCMGIEDFSKMMKDREFSISSPLITRSSLVPELSPQRQHRLPNVKLPSMSDLVSGKLSVTQSVSFNEKNSIASSTSQSEPKLLPIRTLEIDEEKVLSPQPSPTTDCLPSFLKSLYEMVEHGHNALRWVDNGKAFEIYDMSRFISEYLPYYFKHNRFSSFQRQLNMYGFKKWTKTKTSTCTYSHIHFQHGKPAEVALIKRKTNPQYAQKLKHNDKGCTSSGSSSASETESKRKRKRFSSVASKENRRKVE